MRPPLIRCHHCEATGKDLYLHHGQITCAACLVARPDDEMGVRVKITQIRAEAARKAAKRLRGEDGDDNQMP